MNKLYKQLLFVALGVAILAIGGLAIYSATPGGNLKINPILGHDLDLNALYYGQAANNTIHDITTQDISISAWVRLDSDATGSIYEIFGKRNSGDIGYVLYVGMGTSITMYVKDNLGNIFYVTGTYTSNFRDNKWHYVTGIIDKDTQANCKVFVDGIDKSGTRTGDITTVGSVSNLSRKLSLGVLSDLSYNFDGQLRDVKLYYAAGDHWSDAQVLYQAQHPFDYSANAGTLTDYWRLDEGSGATLYGKPTTGNNLTLSNVLAWTTQPKLKVVNQENTTSTQNNPVGWWSFDDGVGASAQDKSGNGNTGTLLPASPNGPTWTTGKLGKGLSFDGVDDYVSVSSGDNLDIGTNDRTYNLWFKVNETSFTTSRTLINSGVGSGSVPGIWIRTTSANTIVVYFCDGSAARISKDFNTNKSIYDSQWHHLSVILDRNVGANLYVDGVISSSGSFDITAQQGSVNDNFIHKIGSYSSGSSLLFNGLIDDVRIYNRALSAGEVAQMYNSTKDGYLGKIKVSTGLVGYWKLDDNNALTSVIDYSGKGNTGTAYSSTATSTSVLSTSTAMVGRAMSFDGVDDYVNAGSGASLPNVGTNSITLSAWVKETSRILNAKIISRRSLANSKYYMLGCLSGKPYAGINDGANEQLTKDVEMPLNQWHYLTFVYSDSDNFGWLYYDGVLTKSGAITQSIPTLTGIKLSIGADYQGTSNFFNGLIDEVRIWNYARSGEEIKQDYVRGTMARSD